MAKAPKAAKETVEETAPQRIAVVNTGLALIFIEGEKLMPGAEMEVDLSFLKTSAAEYLIGQDALIVKDDYDLTEEIKERILARRKKDSFEGKSQKEVENGGEF